MTTTPRRRRCAWLAGKFPLLLAGSIIMLIILGISGLLDDGPARHKGPIAPPPGWLYVGQAPGGWLYVDCQRYVGVIVDHQGKPLTAGMVLLTEADHRQCDTSR